MGSDGVSKAQGWGQHPGPDDNCASIPLAAACYALRRARSPEWDQPLCRLDVTRGKDPCWPGSARGELGRFPGWMTLGGGGCPESWAGTAPLRHHELCSIAERVPKPSAASGQAQRDQPKPPRPKLPPQLTRRWGSPSHLGGLILLLRVAVRLCLEHRFAFPSAHPTAEMLLPGPNPAEPNSNQPQSPLGCWKHPPGPPVRCSWGH